LGGIPEEYFDAYSWNPSPKRWEKLDVTYRNTTGNYLEAYTPHFSTFTAIGEGRADLNVSGLVVSSREVLENGVVDLSATVGNDGVEDSGDVFFAFYSVQGYSVTEVFNTTLSGLAVGDSTTVSYTWNVGNSTGFRDIYAVAVLVNASEYRDYDNVVYGNLTVYTNPAEQSPCGLRTTCGECILQPYPSGENCVWNALSGVCMNITNKCSYCSLGGSNGNCVGACFIGGRPALFIDDYCPDAAGLSNVSWISYEPVQWDCNNDSGVVVCFPPNVTKAPEQFNATLLARRAVSIVEFGCFGSGCSLGYESFVLVPSEQASLFTSNNYTFWVTQPASMYSGGLSSSGVGGLVAMAGGPYIAGDDGVRVSGRLSLDTAGSNISSYVWDVNNDSTGDYNQSTLELSLAELRTKGLKDASVNPIVLKVTDEKGNTSQSTAELRIPYYHWSDTSTSTTSTTTTSTSTTTTTLPNLSGLCRSGDLVAEGFTEAISQCV